MLWVLYIAFVRSEGARVLSYVCKLRKPQTEEGQGNVGFGFVHFGNQLDVRDDWLSHIIAWLPFMQSERKEGQREGWRVCVSYCCVS